MEQDLGRSCIRIVLYTAGCHKVVQADNRQQYCRCWEGCFVGARDSAEFWVWWSVDTWQYRAWKFVACLRGTNALYMVT